MAFTSGGYALRTVHVARARPVPRGARVPTARTARPSTTPTAALDLQPFFPNDSVYRLQPGDHTLLVWADDAFADTLEQPGAAPYVQRVEVRSVR